MPLFFIVQHLVVTEKAINTRIPMITSTTKSSGIENAFSLLEVKRGLKNFFIGYKLN